VLLLLLLLLERDCQVAQLPQESQVCLWQPCHGHCPDSQQQLRLQQQLLPLA
jgi:hypothetical protein